MSARRPLAARRPVAALAMVAVVAMAGCGGGQRGGNGALEAIPGPVAGQKRGGTLQVISHDGFQHLDPGSSFFQLDYQVVYAAHRPLFSYRPDDSRTPVPDLASAPARISPDRRTVTVRIRPGVRYSPGTVDRPVRAADVKYAIERGFGSVVANGYAASYFADLVGGASARGGPIAGIRTPDDRTLVFDLTKPVGATFVNALSLPLTAPVPREYAARLDRASPSRYDSDPTVQAFTGPYVIASYQAGKSLVLARNPNWRRTGDYRPAYLDRVRWAIGADPSVAGRQILAGSHLVNGDTPATSIVARAVKRFPRQINFTPIGNRYIALNTQLAPFGNADVRRAVAAAIDRRALQLTRGGRVAGDVATHFLAPTAPGFEAAGALEGPGYDFLRRPQGDLALARSYLRRAGYRSGRYSGPEILMVGDNSDPADKAAQVVLTSLRQLGFDVRLRLVATETMYSKFCNVPAARVHVCPNVGWLPDFPDGYAWLFPTFDSQAIGPENNTNWSQLRDPRVDAAIARAQSISDPSGRARAWGRVDRMVTGLAAVVPWFWDRTPNLESRDVQGVIARWNAAWDLSFSSLK